MLPNQFTCFGGSPLPRAAHDSFDALSEELQEQVIENVKAVLEAVRSPSDAMLSAGSDASEEPPFVAENAWQAMIDAAIVRADRPCGRFNK